MSRRLRPLLPIRPVRPFRRARPPQALRADALETYGLGLSVWVIAAFSSFLIVTGLLRFAGVVAPMATGAAALVAAACMVRWSLGLSLRVLAVSLMPALLLGAAAVGMAALCRDISFDGPAVYLPAALEIAEGLNPVTTRSDAYYAAVYPNGMWTLQAFFITLTSGFEEGKAPAWLLAFASIPLITLALRTLRGAWSPVVVAVAILVQLNPILLFQLTSFALDGVVYSLSVSTIAGAILLTTRHRRVGLVVVCGALLLMANTKITGLYWAGILGPAVVLQVAIEQRKLPFRMAGLMAAVLVTALVVVGWRPYVTVPLEMGQLFGATSDVASGAANLVGADPFTRMAYLLFSRSSNPVGEQVAQLKWPWELWSSEFITLWDIRNGGFGPWFGMQAVGALLVGAVALWRTRRDLYRDNRWLGPFWVLVLFMSTLLFPVTWWARLVAPFWLVTLLPLVWPAAPAAAPARRTPLLMAGWAMFWAGWSVNAAAAVWTLRLILTVNIAMTQILADVAARHDTVRIVPGPVMEADLTHLVWGHRLIHLGILSRVGPADGCARPLFHTGSVQLCIDKQP